MTGFKELQILPVLITLFLGFLLTGVISEISGLDTVISITAFSAATLVFGLTVGFGISVYMKTRKNGGIVN